MKATDIRISNRETPLRASSSVTAHQRASATLVDSVISHASTMPGARAITFLKAGDAAGASSLTWNQLGVRMRAVAAFLQDRGSPGSCAIVACPPGLDYVVSFLGCLAAGWTPVPAPTAGSRRRDNRLAGIVEDAGASLLMTVSDALRSAKNSCGLPCVTVDSIAETGADRWAPSGASVDDLAFLQYTSGSTSEPRGVMVTHAALRTQLSALSSVTGLRARESVVCWMPLYHDFALVGHLLHSLDAGAHLVLMSPTAFLRRPAIWLEAVTGWRAAGTGAPNFAFDLCCSRITEAERARLNLSSLRILGCGGEPARAETLERFRAAFAANGLRRSALYASYGMAESVLMLSAPPLSVRGESRLRTITLSAKGLESGRVRAPLWPGDARSLVTCGVAVPGAELRIADPDTSQFVAEGRVGEVWARGATIAAGYRGQPRASAETFGARAADGSGPWLRTGDLGFLKNGELVVTGRRKEVIIVRGHNHYPIDIEQTVQAADSSLESGAGAAFFAVVNGEERVVVVQEVARAARRDIDAAAVIAKIRRIVSDVHGLALHDVVLVSPAAVPRTTSGKIQRLACREQWLAGTLPAVTRRGPDAVDTIEAESESVKLHEEVLDEIAVFSKRQVAGGASLRGELELDSLAFVEMVVAMEGRFGVKIGEDRATAIVTANDLAEAVIESRRKGAETGIADLRDQILTQIPQIRVEVTAQRGRELLVDGRWIADFASANYLGLDLHPDVIAAVQPAIERWGLHPSWTRIVASPAIYGELERRLAEFVAAPDVLVFPTVTLAHAGLLPLLAGAAGEIFVDREAHASVHDGALLAAARGAGIVEYNHGDHGALEALLAESMRFPKIIATDGVYSMTAEYENLPALAALARTFDARLYVDDAHGIGVIGGTPCPSDPYGAGNGLVKRCGLDYVSDRIVYVGGMSKAFSSLAAFVTCVDANEKTLFATATTAVHSGPCPTASLASTIAGLDVVAREGPAIRSRLHSLTTRLLVGARAMGFAVDNHDAFPLVSVVVGPTAATIAACRVLWEHGILITPGVFPATPQGRGALRFTVTAANTEAQVDRALEALGAVQTAGLAAFTPDVAPARLAAA